MPESVVSEVISFLKITSTLCAETAGLVRGADVRRASAGAPAVMAPCGVTPFLQALLPDKQQKSGEMRTLVLFNYPYHII